jgi:molecular chaperone GrpE
MTDMNIESSDENETSKEDQEKREGENTPSKSTEEVSNVEELKSKSKDLAEESSEEKESELESLTKDRDKFKEQYYYLAADFENTKKRLEREKSNLVKFGNEKLLSSLVGALDNLDLTLMAVANEEDEKVKNICVGVQMVRDQFFETLKQNGLEVIETEGKDFDPKFHEAISQKEEDGVGPGKVLQEVQKGYVLNGRVVRASKVITSK